MRVLGEFSEGTGRVQRSNKESSENCCREVQWEAPWASVELGQC